MPPSFRPMLALAIMAWSTIAVATDLTGIWSDDRGVPHRLRQDGSKLYWSCDDTASGGYANVFWGDVSGNTISGSWIDLPGSPALDRIGDLVMRIESDSRLARVSGNYATRYLVRQGTRPGGENTGNTGTGGFGYVGCFRDSDPRALDGAFWQDGGMTTERCVAYCAQKGFPYAGTQFSSQCFCGNGYDRYGAASGACDMRCGGNQGQTCGGSWANSVYAVGGGAAGGPCADPRTQTVMDEWLTRATPPDNQRPGWNLRYEPWGRLVGTSPSATLTAPNRPDTSLTRCDWLWQRAAQLDSLNLGTMKLYLEQRGIR